MISFQGVGPSSSLEARERFFLEHKNTTPFPRIFLATCDRVEIYSGDGLPDEHSFRHLLRVVSGLESPMIGENQIQSQVKEAYREACNLYKLSSELHRLFQTALRVGKRIRTETGITKGAIGHAQATVNLIRTLPVPLKELRILIIGVNNISRGILRYLVSHGNKTLFLGNRTLEKACSVCKELGGGEAFHLEELQQRLADCDAVISATSAPHMIIYKKQLPPTGGPRWFFDLASPRDIDPQIASIEGVKLYNITDIESSVRSSMESRRNEIAEAEKIIEQEAELYFGKVGMLS